VDSSNEWIPPKPVIFAALLCLLMLVGEIFSDWRSSTSLVFYSFLPAVIWMIFIRMKRNTEVITELKAQVDRLEESRRSS
jgi:hypothetical protein